MTCVELVFPSILSKLITGGQLLVQQFTPGINMHLEWPSVIRSHVPLYMQINRNFTWANGHCVLYSKNEPNLQHLPTLQMVQIIQGLSCFFCQSFLSQELSKLNVFLREPGDFCRVNYIGYHLLSIYEFDLNDKINLNRFTDVIKYDT